MKTSGYHCQIIVGQPDTHWHSVTLRGLINENYIAYMKNAKEMVLPDYISCLITSKSKSVSLHQFHFVKNSTRSPHPTSIFCQL
jgi:hypothetical protein